LFEGLGFSLNHKSMQTTSEPAQELISYRKLKDFSYEVFLAMGCPESHALIASDVLVAADLRGVDSHGVARLSGYVRLWKAGRINPKPNFKILHQTASTATFEADGALGLVAAPKAMELAIEKAHHVGSGWVSVCNSNHFGIAGYHALIATAQDMIGMAMTNASPLVAPTFSTEKMLGTNPIAFSVPAGKYPPFVADFATTTAANGKLEILQRKGNQAPLGWIQDAQGEPTTNPNALKDGGALLPLGSDREHGSHKGYCLGSMVDILSGVLSGANFGPWVPPFVAFLEPLPDLPGRGLGHFLGAMRVDAFRPKEDFFKNIELWIERFSQAKPQPPQSRVLIPGQIEFETAQQRLQEGIPLLSPVLTDLRLVAKEFALEI
jgi:LDH2 family malate/lactate/ureidoglycolate dehydrogenase